jgi:ATP synthase protein I
MSFEPSPEQSRSETGVSKILAVQLLLTVGVVWLFYYYQGLLAAQAALYGGCIVIFNVWIMNRRLRTAAKIAKIAPGQEVKVFYIAAVQKFVFTLGFFIFGMRLLDLPPIPLLVAFAIVQTGYFFHGQGTSHK